MAKVNGLDSTNRKAKLTPGSQALLVYLCTYQQTVTFSQRRF